jgi:hypothetical protein
MPRLGYFMGQEFHGEKIQSSLLPDRGPSGTRLFLRASRRGDRRRLRGCCYPTDDRQSSLLMAEPGEVVPRHARKHVLCSDFAFDPILTKHLPGLGTYCENGVRTFIVQLPPELDNPVGVRGYEVLNYYDRSEP